MRKLLRLGFFKILLRNKICTLTVSHVSIHTAPSELFPTHFKTLNFFLAYQIVDSSVNLNRIFGSTSRALSINFLVIGTFTTKQCLTLFNNTIIGVISDFSTDRTV